MARNREKAQSMLYRFRESLMRESSTITSSASKRKESSNIRSLNWNERQRDEVARQIVRNIQKLQDPSQSELELRELNDQVNKALKQKAQFEWRIKEYGGSNTGILLTSLIQETGKEAPGSKGYMYFGRAQQLPGVQELFLQHGEALQGQQSTQKETIPHLDPDYYGFRDELDGRLLDYECKLETKARQEFEIPAEQELTLQDLPDYGIPDQKQVEEWIVKKKAAALRAKLDL